MSICRLAGAAFSDHPLNAPATTHEKRSAIRLRGCGLFPRYPQARHRTPGAQGISVEPLRKPYSAPGAQGYPLTPDEAFMASNFDSFITADLVMQARKETDIESYGPLLIGVDPAGKGADATAIAWRRGHRIEKIEKRRGLTTMEIAGLIGKIIREEKPAKVNIDVGGLGIGVHERLIEQGHDSSVVTAVNFGGKPLEPPPLDEAGKPAGGPANRRAELWQNMKSALQGRFSIPDSDTLHSDLTSVGYKYMSDGRLLLEAKEDMKKRGMPSPDEGDAMALCFSEPEGSPFPRSANFNRKIVYWDQGYV
jgi:hypothetical protein